MLMLRLISIGLSGVSTCTQADRPAAAQRIARVRPPMVSLLSSLFDKIMALARFLKADRAFPRPPWRRRPAPARAAGSSEEHTSDLQSLMRIAYAVFCLKQQKNT